MFGRKMREYVEVSECGWLNIHERQEWLSKKTSENHEVAKPPSGFHEFFWITTRVLSEYCHPHELTSTYSHYSILADFPVKT